MYTPRFNQVSDRTVLIEAMRSYFFAIVFGPLASSETADATHLPLVVKDEGPHGTIQGHFARANPHCSALSHREALVVFSGPHTYVSPTLYVEPLSVPTWNYIAIHASGTVELVEDEAGKNALLEDLIEINEPAYAEKWRDMPQGFRSTMLAGKFKISQNRAEADRRNVRAAHAAGTPDQQALAAWMAKMAL